MCIIFNKYYICISIVHIRILYVVYEYVLVHCLFTVLSYLDFDDSRRPRSPLYSLSGHSERLLDVDWSSPQLLATAAADSTLKLFAAPGDYSI